METRTGEVDWIATLSAEQDAVKGPCERSFDSGWNANAANAETNVAAVADELAMVPSASGY